MKQAKGIHKDFFLHPIKAIKHHANMDDFDPKKGKSSGFHIYLRQNAEGNKELLENLTAGRCLKRKMVLIVSISLLSIAALTVVIEKRSYVIMSVVTATDGRVLSKTMDVDADMAAAILNEMDIGN